jgi:hypothetical protein
MPGYNNRRSKLYRVGGEVNEPRPIDKIIPYLKVGGGHRYPREFEEKMQRIQELFDAGEINGRQMDEMVKYASQDIEQYTGSDGRLRGSFIENPGKKEALDGRELMTNKMMDRGGRMYYFNGGEIEGEDTRPTELNVSTEERPGLLFGEKQVLKDESGDEYARVKQMSRLARMLGAADTKASFGNGGKMYFVNGGEMDIEGDPKKPSTSVVRNPYTTVPSADVSYRNNEGMQQATSQGKIDAYNFSLPESGNLDDMDDEMKSRLRGTDFGKEYLSGDGSLDQQYQAYSNKVNAFIDENPGETLTAINKMIESGNENFKVLEGKSDAEKLAMARRYMTDKKIGDFHGAITFGEKIMPTTSFYDPNPRIAQGGFRGGESIPKVLRSVGGESLNEGDVMAFQRYAKGMGVDVSQDTPEARKAFQSFISQKGSSDWTTGVETGKDNYQYLQSAVSNYQQGMQTAAQKAKARREENARQAAAMKARQ